jgi:hypothetical protein
MGKLMGMRHPRAWATAATAAVATALVAGAATAPAGAKSSTASLRNFHGTVLSVSKSDGTLRLRRSASLTTTFRITSATVFDGLRGISALTRGRAIEVKARQVNGRWVARKIEPATQAEDDHGGHGADDPAGHH